MRHFSMMACVAMIASAPAFAQSKEAITFGAREAVQQMSLSPDGKRVVFSAPGKGAESALYVASIGEDQLKHLLTVDGKPEQLGHCHWASNARVICDVYLVTRAPGTLVPFSRAMTIDVDTGVSRIFSAPESSRSTGIALGSGQVIDWSGGSDGSVLMTRYFVADSDIGTRLAKTGEGVGVERVDAATLLRRPVETPRKNVAEYIADGRGNVRVMGVRENGGIGNTYADLNYFYRLPDSREWRPLAHYNTTSREGFNPFAVDPANNIVYGLEKLNGRQALYTISLDGQLVKKLVYDNNEVDVDNIIRVGRQERVVGVGFATDKRQVTYFDAKLQALAASLSRALPKLPQITFIDASADESRLLLYAGSDRDAGRYYVFDKPTKNLMELMLTRPTLEKATLAEMKPITFTTADGTKVPSYLTLPPGSLGKGIPAIVMPHGGPSARDEWGFDWLVQFFASRGYAVLQPNYRGSMGYGDDWYVQNGFKSWRAAIGDVNEAGRWLVSQGIADPSKLAIVGWSYGGYAALQSVALDPQLYKAVVAIAPVTDLPSLRQEWQQLGDYRAIRDFVGTGPQVTEGSPSNHAAEFRAPVLMFHGDMDRNVAVEESRLMERRLMSAGKKVELVTFPGLDHQLPDSQARIQMLDKTDNFLRAALKIN